MPEEERKIPEERFIYRQDWPKPRQDEGEEPSHPDLMPDDSSGPFLPNFWEGRDDREDNEEEIGYEGER